MPPADRHEEDLTRFKARVNDGRVTIFRMAQQIRSFAIDVAENTSAVIDALLLCRGDQPVPLGHYAIIIGDFAAANLAKSAKRIIVRCFRQFTSNFRIAGAPRHDFTIRSPNTLFK
jgi:hypothetical protein